MNPKFSIDYSIIRVMVDEHNTAVTIQDDFTGEIFTGWAACNPKDEFNLSLGVAIAEKRAIRKMVDASLDDDITNLSC